MSKATKNLTPLFKPIVYNGSRGEDNYMVHNILKNDESFHCTKKGFNHDLVLEYTQPHNFLMTNFCLIGPLPGLCSAPVKTAIVFISSKKPNIKSYTGKFDDCQNEKEFKKKFRKKSDRVGFFVTTDDVFFQFEAYFTKGVSGRYIHIKFIHPHAGDNIDIHKIGIVGLIKPEKGFILPKKLNKIPLEMNLTLRNVQLIDINRCPNIVYFMRVKLYNVVLYTNDKNHVKELSKLTKEEVYQKNFNFFYSDFTHRMGYVLLTYLLEYDRLNFVRDHYSKKMPFLVISKSGKVQIVESIKIHQGDITSESISKFADQFLKDQKQLINLTPSFEVTSYNGGSSNGNVIENSLNLKKDFHTSKKGKNFDLVMKYRGFSSFTCTNFCIIGPYKCTAPIASGCVFFFDEVPSIQNYSKRFDGCNKDTFIRLKKKFKLKGFFFETDDVNYQFERSFPDGIRAKFVHIKFVSSHKIIKFQNEEVFAALQLLCGFEDETVDVENGIINDHNIDVFRIGFYGLEGSQDLKNIGVPERVPSNVKMTVNSYYPLIYLDIVRNLSRYYKKKPSAIIISNNQTHLDVMKTLSEKSEYNDKFHFFRGDFIGERTQKIMKKLKLKPNQKLSYVLIRGDYLIYKEKGKRVGKLCSGSDCLQHLVDFLGKYVKITHDITNHFKVDSYDGGVFMGVNVKRILKNPVNCPQKDAHLTKEGRNFDLVLEYKGVTQFHMTNFAIIAPFMDDELGASPLKFGIVFVSNSKIPKEITKKFDNVTNVDSFNLVYNEQVVKNHVETAIFFSTNDVLAYEHYFPNGVNGRFLYIKFISPHDVELERMAISALSIVGWEKPIQNLESFKVLDPNMFLTRHYPEDQLIDLDDERLSDLTIELFKNRFYEREKASVVIFSKKTQDKKWVENLLRNQIPESLSKFRFFYSDFEGPVSKTVTELFQITNLKPQIVIYDRFGGMFSTEKKKISKASVDDFIDDFNQGNVSEIYAQAKMLEEVIKVESSKHYSMLFFENWLKVLCYTVINSFKSRYFMIEIFILFVEFNSFESIVVPMLVFSYIAVDLIFVFLMANWLFVKQALFWCFPKQVNPPYRSVFEYIVEIENNYENTLYKLFKAGFTFLIIAYAITLNTYYGGKSLNTEDFTCQLQIANSTNTTRCSVGVFDFVNSIYVNYQTEQYRNCSLHPSGTISLEYYKGAAIGLFNLLVFVIFRVLLYNQYSCDRYSRNIGILRKKNVPFPTVKIRFANMLVKDTEQILQQIISGLYYLTSRKVLEVKSLDLDDESLNHLDLTYFQDLSAFEMGFLEYFFIHSMSHKSDNDDGQPAKLTMDVKKRRRMVFNFILGYLFISGMIVGSLIGSEIIIVSMKYFYNIELNALFDQTLIATRMTIYVSTSVFLFLVFTFLFIFFILWGEKYEKHVENFYSYANYLLHNFGWKNHNKIKISKIGYENEKIETKSFSLAFVFCYQKLRMNFFKRIYQFILLLFGGYILIILILFFGSLLIIPIFLVGLLSIIIYISCCCCNAKDVEKGDCKDLWKAMNVCICSFFTPCILCFSYVKYKDKKVFSDYLCEHNVFCCGFNLIDKVFQYIYKVLFESNYKSPPDIFEWGHRMSQVNRRKIKTHMQKISEEFDIPYQKFERERIIRSDLSKGNYNFENLHQNILLFNFRCHLQKEALQVLKDIIKEKNITNTRIEKLGEREIKEFQFILGRFWCQYLLEKLNEVKPSTTMKLMKFIQKGVNVDDYKKMLRDETVQLGLPVATDFQLEDVEISEPQVQEEFASSFDLPQQETIRIEEIDLEK